MQLSFKEKISVLIARFVIGLLDEVFGLGGKHRSMHSRDMNYVAPLSRMANQF